MLPSRRWLLTPFLWLALFSLLLHSQTGCVEPGTSQSSGLVPVSGQVLLDGDPIAGAKVVFLPQQLFTADGKLRKVAAALTDQQGRFNLLTEGQPGASPGQYWVLLSKLEPTAGGQLNQPLPEPLASKPAGEGGEPASSNGQQEELFPDFFNSATRLVVNVPGQGIDSARFDLSIFDLPLQEPGR